MVRQFGHLGLVRTCTKIAITAQIILTRICFLMYRWAELWLNEGLATFLSYVAVDQVRTGYFYLTRQNHLMIKNVGLSRVQNGRKIRP